MKNFDTLSYTTRPKAGCQSVRKADNQYRSLFAMLGMDRHETGSLVLSAMCLPSVYQTSSHITRSPSNQIPVVGMAWERG